MSNNLIIINAHIVTPQGRTARKGEAMNELLNIPCGTVRVTDGIITYVGENRISHEKPGYKVLDARGNVLLPGFVDSHTHLVFGGFRPDEFIWRLNGDSYMSIMERGGGIINTVRATREASFEELKHKAEWFLDTMSRMGVTTVEGKSGYGLDRDTELKQLSVMQAINECPDRKVDIATTFLGAHALPEEYKGRSDAYIDFLINEMLPMIHQKQLAENCDIFCEKGVFTVEQSRKLLKAAQALGFGAKLHADEIVSFGGAELAGELKALSADHLLQASDEGIKALAQNNVVATLLPLTAFTLKEPYARGRKMIDSGCAVRSPTTGVEIPPEFFLVHTQFVYTGRKFFVVGLALRTADNLADLREQHVHRTDGLSILVLLHVESLDLLRIVDKDHRTLEVLLDQIAFVFRLQVAPPVAGEFELAARSLENLHALGVIQPLEFVVQHEVEPLDQTVVPHLVHELQILAAVLQRVADQVFQEILGQLHVVLQLVKGHFRLTIIEYIFAFLLYLNTVSLLSIICSSNGKRTMRLSWDRR